MKKLTALSALLLAALVPTTANAWFFFILPGSVTNAISDKVTGAEGDNCVGPFARVGDRITMPGKGTGLIRSLSGTSMRCTTSEFPIRALVDFASTELPLQSTPAISNFHPSPPVLAPASNSAASPVLEWQPEKSFHAHQCVYESAKVGDFFYEKKNGNGVITRLLGASPDCPDVGAARQVIVRFNGDGPKKAEESTQTGKTPSESPELADAPVQVRGTTQKLRELNNLLKEGLITQDDYEGKKQQLLKAF